MSKRSPGHTTTTTPSFPVSKKRKVDTTTVKNKFIEEFEQTCNDLLARVFIGLNEKKEKLLEKIEETAQNGRDEVSQQAAWNRTDRYKFEEGERERLEEIQTNWQQVQKESKDMVKEAQVEYDIVLEKAAILHGSFQVEMCTHQSLPINEDSLAHVISFVSLGKKRIFGTGPSVSQGIGEVQGQDKYAYTQIVCKDFYKCLHESRHDKLIWKNRCMTLWKDKTEMVRKKFMNMPKSVPWQHRMRMSIAEERAKKELDACLLEAKELLDQGERDKEEREEQGSWDCEHHFDEQWARQDLHNKKEEAQQAMDELLIESRRELNDDDLVYTLFDCDYDEALDIGGILNKIEEEMEKASPIEKEKLALEKKEYQEYLIQKRQSSWNPESEDWKYVDSEGKKKIDDAIKDVMDALENAKATDWGGDDY